MSKTLKTVSFLNDGIIQAININLQKLKGISQCKAIHKKIEIDDNMKIANVIKKDEAMVLVKGHRPNGELISPKLFNKDIKEVDETLKIQEIDLYEQSIYLYDCKRDGEFIEGLVIDVEGSRKEKTLVFTEKKARVHELNTNNIIKYSTLKEFINGAII